MRFLCDLRFQVLKQNGSSRFEFVNIANSGTPDPNTGVCVYTNAAANAACDDLATCTGFALPAGAPTFDANGKLTGGGGDYCNATGQCIPGICSCNSDSPPTITVNGKTPNANCSAHCTNATVPNAAPTCNP